MYKIFEDFSTHRCLADMMGKFNGKKEKWTNKGTDKQYVADIFNTHYNLSYQMFVQNFKVLCHVVLEKSLTKISIFITWGVRDSKSGK